MVSMSGTVAIAVGFIHVKVLNEFSSFTKGVGNGALGDVHVKNVGLNSGIGVPQIADQVGGLIEGGEHPGVAFVTVQGFKKDFDIALFRIPADLLERFQKIAAQSLDGLIRFSPEW